MKTEIEIEELIEEVRSALVEFEYESLRGNHASNWHALRIWPDGRISVVCEASQKTPESEYFGRVPHPLTFKTESANCFAPDPSTGWACVESETGSRIAPVLRGAIAPWGNYDVVDGLSEEDLADKLAAGWKRFDLDLQDWCGDPPVVDEDIILAVREWAENNLQ